MLPFVVFNLTLFVNAKQGTAFSLNTRKRYFTMAKQKKATDSRDDHSAVKTPRPPQRIDPSSPPGKGRNKVDDKRGDMDEGDRTKKR